MIHQIEVTSRCNLRCEWCAHASPNMHRQKIDMSWETFTRTLEWREWRMDYIRNLDNGVPADVLDLYVVTSELNLSGVGEPFMNPLLTDMVRECRTRYGDDLRIVIPTNGLLLHEETARKLAPLHPELHFSMHSPKQAAKAIHIAKRYGLFFSAAESPTATPNTWGGQVDWIEPLPDERTPCPWLSGLDWLFVAANGDILQCCLDITGESRLGSVYESPRAFHRKSWRVCSTCHQIPCSSAQFRCV